MPSVTAGQLSFNVNVHVTFTSFCVMFSADAPSNEK
jgi:hypothetical protein